MPETNKLTWTDSAYTDLQRREQDYNHALNQERERLRECEEQLASLNDARACLYRNTWTEYPEIRETIRNRFNESNPDDDTSILLRSLDSLVERALFPNADYHQNRSNILRGNVRDYEGYYSRVKAQLRSYAPDYDPHRSVTKAELAHALRNIPNLCIDTLEISQLNQTFSVVIKNIFIDPEPHQQQWVTTDLPELRIPLPPLRITIRPSDNWISIAPAYNTAKPFIWAGEPTCHPHVLNGAPCFSDYGPPITVALSSGDWALAFSLISQFLANVTDEDSAGMTWRRGVYRLLRRFNNDLPAESHDIDWLNGIMIREGGYAKVHQTQDPHTWIVTLSGYATNPITVKIDYDAEINGDLDDFDDSRNTGGYDEDGYDEDGYDDDGYDRDGYSPDGYDRDGYDRDGYDEDGYDRDGYDRDGYDSDGYDSDGYDRDGYNEDGYDRDGYNEDGYDPEGYDSEGYDSEGYDRDGYDSDGYDRDGRTQDDAVPTLESTGY
jgi:hypothetical protein